MHVEKFFSTKCPALNINKDMNYIFKSQCLLNKFIFVLVLMNFLIIRNLMLWWIYSRYMIFTCQNQTHTCLTILPRYHSYNWHIHINDWSRMASHLTENDSKRHNHELRWDCVGFQWDKHCTNLKKTSHIYCYIFDFHTFMK